MAYPFIVFYILNEGISFRALGLILAFLVAFNFLTYRKFYALIIGIILSLLLILFDNSFFLKIYPVLMNFIVASIFVLSLKEEQPLIEQFATKMGYIIDEQGKKYTRKSTIAWSIFLTFNFIMSFATLFWPLKIWTLYNGFISYILIGTAVAIEFFVHNRKIEKCR